jgi:CHAT domain-containing protein/tetratricopeptide (TPR) repeat protein
MRALTFALTFAVGISSLLAPHALAQRQSPLLADSFRIGSGDGVLCQAQSRSRDPAVKAIFDRAWSIVCRDASRPIGKLYALRGNEQEANARLSEIRAKEADCTAQSRETLEGAGTVNIATCQLRDTPVAYRSISLRRGNITWVAEGLSAYDSALKLGLRSILTDSLVAGKIDVATSLIDDPVAFARVQAGTLDPEKALAEGYRRNNSGAYAEASEFFDTLAQLASASTTLPERSGEYLINRALQKSNLGEFSEADRLFGEARKLPENSLLYARLNRNFEAMHLLNQQRLPDAVARLNAPVERVQIAKDIPSSAIEIGAQVAAEINAVVPVGQRLSSSESQALTVEERASLLDSQAQQLQASILRVQGKASAAVPLLQQALGDVLRVRNGRVVSVIRLRGQILTDLALALDASGDASAAERTMLEATTLIDAHFPKSAVSSSVRARYAGLLARQKKEAEAITQFRTVVADLAASRTYLTGFGNLLVPYLDLLSARMASEPGLAKDFFLTTQILVRPGIADTQAVLARELSEGSSDGSRLFRQARTLERDIERQRVDFARLSAIESPTQDVQTAKQSILAAIDGLERQQTATQAQLSGFPQYRAVAAQSVSLDELGQTLKAGEGYFKMTTAGERIYGFWQDSQGGTGFRIGMTTRELDSIVDTLRDSIVQTDSGEVLTFAYDAPLARRLFIKLMGPVTERAIASKAIVFEPDGAMMRLPLNLLISDGASLVAYLKRLKQPDSDAFDMRGVGWLGRGRVISTTVSAKAFRDARTLQASTARKAYIGFGQNAPSEGPVTVARTRALFAPDAPECNWPRAAWNNPISADELKLAQSIIGVDRSAIVIDGAFTDTDILARKDLSDYRIIHFATHGLVTGPRPECPAQPALLTSFGNSDSDGLLTFKEIFDLKLNADVVILSACDTAGEASIATTREAGVTSGGGNALDGLVRAFIGAGGRTILASHWVAPDDFDATKRLIGGMFEAPSGTGIGEALLKGQQELMDDVRTSHPYYWSVFAIVGDGGQPLLTDAR